MAERKYDRSLNISTVGLREWPAREKNYNRYEATPYQALEKLLKIYSFKDVTRVVDFGCGRGRVSFFLHHHLNLPVTGVEVNDETLDEALSNYESYLRKSGDIDVPLQFHFGLAEQFELEPVDNCFYFFNPFSVQIFKKVIYNILRSVEETKRHADLILYYPLPEYQRVLERTPFEIIHKIKATKAHGKYGKFIVYRYVHEESQLD